MKQDRITEQLVNIARQIEMRIGDEYEEFANMNMYFKGDKKYEKRKLDEFKQLEVDRKNYKIE